VVTDFFEIWHGGLPGDVVSDAAGQMAMALLRIFAQDLDAKDQLNPQEPMDVLILTKTFTIYQKNILISRYNYNNV